MDQQQDMDQQQNAELVAEDWNTGFEQQADSQDWNMEQQQETEPVVEDWDADFQEQNAEFVAEDWNANVKEEEQAEPVAKEDWDAVVDQEETPVSNDNNMEEWSEQVESNFDSAESWEEFDASNTQEGAMPEEQEEVPQYHPRQARRSVTEQQETAAAVEEQAKREEDQQEEVPELNIPCDESPELNVENEPVQFAQADDENQTETVYTTQPAIVWLLGSLVAVFACILIVLVLVYVSMLPKRQVRPSVVVETAQ
eukprot:m.60936 g.60936  ORF g.60936 m.60936 type:complete len:255 (+) comp19232_c0_seq2:2-766(+)